MPSNESALEYRTAQLIRALSALADDTAHGDKIEVLQATLLDQLESIGPAAVPYIVKNMDVRKPLAVTHMRLANKFPNAWEGYRTYRPRQVVDALAAILDLLTGKTMLAETDIFNGEGSSADRDALIAAWKKFVQSAKDRSSHGRNEFSNERK